VLNPGAISIEHTTGAIFADFWLIYRLEKGRVLTV